MPLVMTPNEMKQLYGHAWCYEAVAAYRKYRRYARSESPEPAFTAREVELIATLEARQVRVEALAIEIGLQPFP